MTTGHTPHLPVLLPVKAAGCRATIQRLRQPLTLSPGGGGRPAGPLCSCMRHQQIRGRGPHSPATFEPYARAVIKATRGLPHPAPFREGVDLAAVGIPRPA